MRLKINEAARLTGITVRTLHYYDEIGLLKPGIVTDSGYRMYDEENLEMLQQILFFKELDFPLNEIKDMLNNPGFSKTEALQKHRELLLKKRERLDRLIALTEKTIKGEKKMNFEEFNSKDIEAAKEKYAKEVKERWGDSEAYAESKRRTDSYGKKEWAAIDAGTKEIFGAFAGLSQRNIAPDSEEALRVVKRWQDFISKHFYPCSNEILSGLGMMYTEDERFRNNLDKFGAGTAEYMSAAIKSYCKD